MAGPDRDATRHRVCAPRTARRPPARLGPRLRGATLRLRRPMLYHLTPPAGRPQRREKRRDRGGAGRGGAHVEVLVAALFLDALHGQQPLDTVHFLRHLPPRLHASRRVHIEGPADRPVVWDCGESDGPDHSVHQV